MDAREVLAVCIADEAGNQSHAGRVAVGTVVMNRTRLKYFSDGSVLGTVLRKDQFSGFWFAMVAGHYTRVATTMDDATHRLADKRRLYGASPTLWADCLKAADEAMAGPPVAPLTPLTVLYYNPAIVPTPPAWATLAKRDGVVGAHVFYHA